MLKLVLNDVKKLFVLNVLAGHTGSKKTVVNVITDVVMRLFITEFRAFRLLLCATSNFVSYFIVNCLTDLFFGGG